ncbi:MAG TPA: hypothetical protein VD994_00925 [Prosthecobacter sp.]|nr:hypothetical protein [Prosthecobacter sp.]
MVVALFDAIKTKFEATAALTTGITGGIFYQEVAAGTATPYMVVSTLPSELVDAYSNAISGDLKVQFAVFGEGARVVAVLMESVLAAYDNTTLTLTGNTNIGMYRVDVPHQMLQPAEGAYRNQNSKDVWGSYVTYCYSVQ